MDVRYFREVSRPDRDTLQVTEALIFSVPRIVLTTLVRGADRAEIGATDDSHYYDYMENYARAQSVDGKAVHRTIAIPDDTAAQLLAHWEEYRTARGNGGEQQAKQQLGQSLTAILATCTTLKPESRTGTPRDPAVLHGRWD